MQSKGKACASFHLQAQEATSFPLDVIQVGYSKQAVIRSTCIYKLCYPAIEPVPTMLT